MFVKFAFLADTVSMGEAGKITAVGIFDVIFATKFPLVHRDMTLVAKLEGTVNETGEHKFSVELRDDKANKLASFDQKIALEKSPVRQATLKAGVMAKLQDLRFQRAGEYEFVMFADDRFLGRVVFTVQQLHVTKVGES